jgi:LuxR family transcriptional regulator, maltose regulon positive regulatory protein
MAALDAAVSVVAPAGYGKTTLLSQWAERNGHAFAWVSVDEADNDPKVLLTYVAEALDAVQPVGGRVFDALASPASSVPGSVVPRLAAALGFVSEYVESEFLARISERQRVFLTRTAVLERMCGPLCEAMLDLPGSAGTLAELARSNLLLVPLDQRGQWYRYHHLFRDMLLAQLERQDPGLIPVLRRRAADWYLRHGMDEDALEYSMAAGDVDEVARLVQKLWLPADRQGRAATLKRWFGWLGERDGIATHPMLAVQAACLAAETGQPTAAERWADLVDRRQFGDGTQSDEPSTEAWAAVMRAILCRHGIEQMLADADEAVRRFAEQDIMVPAAAALQGIARILGGDLDGGDALLQEAFSAGQEVAAPDVLAVLLCERSLAAMARSQWGRAEALAGQARTVLRQGGLDDIYISPLVCAAQARVALHRGDITTVRRELVEAQRLRALLTYAVPHAAVQARIELARVHLALADIAGARTLMREIDEVLERRPGLGTLVGEAEALRTQLSRQRGASSPGASALTAAELRVVPLLATWPPT